MTEEQRRAACARAEMEYRERAVDHANLNGQRWQRAEALRRFQAAQSDYEDALTAAERSRLNADLTTPS